MQNCPQPDSLSTTCMHLRIPPPIVALLAGALIWWLARAAPSLHVMVPGRIVISVVFVVLGVAAVAGVRR